MDAEAAFPSVAVMEIPHLSNIYQAEMRILRARDTLANQLVRYLIWELATTATQCVGCKHPGEDWGHIGYCAAPV